MISQLLRELTESIDEQASIVTWKDDRSLAASLQKKYHFYRMDLLERTFLLMEPLSALQKISQLVEEMHLAKEQTGLDPVVFVEELRAYRRKRLLKERIAFMSRSQFFLPEVSLLLRKTTQGRRRRTEVFSPTTQLVFLVFLYEPKLKANATQLAERLSISVMSASRALNALLEADLVHFRVGGKTNRSKEYQRVDDEEYFHVGKDFLQSPILRTVRRKDIASALKAGEEALYEKHMGDAPLFPVRAIGEQEYEKRFSQNKKTRETLEETIPLLEIWSYDPKLVSHDDLVDPLSLRMSRRDPHAEWTEEELDELTREITWYMD